MPEAKARQMLPHLLPAMRRFEIVSLARAAAFLAQCHVESGRFTRTEENLRYSSAERLVAVFPSRIPTVAAAQPFLRNPEGLANHVYGGRLGNGPPASGDGWRFRGRGLKQLTGRANYQRAAAGLGRPYLADPDLVAQAPDAALTAAWFWQQAGCNALADAGDIDRITRAINGPARLAAAERAQRTADYRRVLAPAFSRGRG
ncbi:MAG: glycoside hydrolase family 19 protein [Sphingomonadaceae bacterium]